MIRFFRANKEIIYPIIISVFLLIALIIFQSPIYDKFISAEINKTISDIAIWLTGFLLTAYTIFLGFQGQITRKLSKTDMLEKVEKRFRLVIYFGIILLIFSLVFSFINFKILPPIILSILFFLILLLFKLLGYLKILFDDSMKNEMKSL